MSAEASYVPGTWVAVSARDAWLLVALAPEHEVVQRCWSLLSDGAAVDEVLDALVSGGVRATPAFALVRSVDGERRAMARGAATITITDDHGGVEVKVSAAAGTVWADEGFGADVDVLLLASNEPSVSAVELPMAAGVTMAASIRVRARAGERPSIKHFATSDEARPARVEPAAVEPAAVGVADVQVSVLKGPAADVTAIEPPEVEPPEVEPTAADAPDYDFLFGATQRPTSSDPGAPIGEATSGWSTAAPLIPDAAPVATPGVIDGLPWMVPAPPPISAPPAGEIPTGPTVLAGYCPAGHLSPPHAPVCRVCRAPMSAQQAGFEIARPPLGVLRLSTGDVVTLDRGVLLGRAPEVPADALPRPHAVRLRSPENDISRTHAEIVLDGWHVYVRDLNSTNGTMVTLPGQSPQRVRPNDLQLLENGAEVNLADEVTFTFEVNA